MTLGAASPADPVFEAVRRNLLTVIPELEPEAVSMDRALVDLGCNSIDRAEVVTLAMEQLGITVPLAEFRNVNDIEVLVELLRKYT